VISTPSSAREARTQFELGNGDALVTYELDGLLMKLGNAKVDAEIVIPEATIFSEHPAVVIDQNVSAADRRSSMPLCSISGATKRSGPSSNSIFVPARMMR